MSIRGQQPMGVGAYTHADQPSVKADDGYGAPPPDNPLPPGAKVPPPPPLARWVLPAIVVVVVGVVAVGVVAILAFVVPAQYPQHETLTLDSAQGWHQSICVPDEDAFGSVTTNVSFTWSTDGPYSATLQVSYPNWPGNSSTPVNQVLYNATGPSGSGWYTSPPGPWSLGGAYFAASGLSNPSISAVTVNISYDLPGHYLGGPPEVSGCG